ncbi:MAG: glutamate synthase [Myxococcales bacterium]|nr:glutamate synthase [Myxococcales bacterium]MCB9712549.1 glutamate synthase [Myxococcales bacterium]
MAELRPYPIGALLTRMFRELDEHDAIFHLPRRKLFTGDEHHDTSVVFQGHVAGSPLGPAAGPQSQMAQNIVLSWLAGCRIFELKTVQILDELRIPRPCIDMQTIGYNVEWSQELKLEESLEEYVKGAMLVRILEASGRLPVSPSFAPLVYDMSVGYDLKGIRSERVQAFIHGMMDCSEVVDRLRAQIPDEFAEYRDLDFQTKLSDTLTLSTFHGCPPHEIEGIIDFLLRELHLHCIVKLNPTLLGPQRLRELLHDTMGYTEQHVPDTAFANDTKWDQAVGFCERLGATAEGLGLHFGAKFSNTLIVHNHRDFFPASEKEMYLSGAPLHVLAMSLVGRFRQTFGDRFPVSFSAGINARNFSDAVALGLAPITVCSDLLQPGGYGRTGAYYKELARRMDEVGAATVDDYLLRAYGNAEAALDAEGIEGGARQACLEALEAGGTLDEAVPDRGLARRWLSRVKVLNTETYVQRVTADPRYRLAANAKPPKKVGSSLVLLDCLSCDKCLPVCPNDANFTFVLPQGQVPVLKLRPGAAGFVAEAGEPLTVAKKHQIANFADFCNECGNCDVFCPEDGGPYLIKPRFFGSRRDWEAFADHDGFYVERSGPARTVLGRFGGQAFEARIDGARASFVGAGFALELDPVDPAGSVTGKAEGEVDLTYFHLMDMISAAVLEAADNYVSAAARA